MTSLVRRSFAELFTLTRASVANYVAGDGTIASAAINRARQDFDPVTLRARGLLIEEARTNVFLNSAAPAAQSVTVTAQPYALSFWGAGQVVLTGAASATLVGSANGSRAVLVFTPSAGSLTLTPSGEVNYAQLEAGAYATSFITTAGSAVARSRDVCSVASMDPWFDDGGGTVLAEVLLGYTPPADGVLRRVWQADDGTESNRVAVYLNGGTAHAEIKSGGATVCDLTLGSLGGTTPKRVAFAWSADNCAAISSGGTLATDSAAAIPGALSVFRLGSAVAAGSELSGAFRTLRYWPRRLSNSELRAAVL